MSGLTEQEFADKVEWEGGLLDLLIGYGLTYENVEEGILRDMLENIAPLIAELEHQTWAIEGYLETLTDVDDE